MCRREGQYNQKRPRTERVNKDLQEDSDSDNEPLSQVQQRLLNNKHNYSNIPTIDDYDDAIPINTIPAN